MDHETTGADIEPTLRDICGRLRRNDPTLTVIDFSTDDMLDSVQELDSSFCRFLSLAFVRELDLSDALQENTVVTSIVGICLLLFGQWGGGVPMEEPLGSSASARWKHFFRTCPSLRTVHLSWCSRYIYECEMAAEWAVEIMQAIGDSPFIQEFILPIEVWATASSLDYILRSTSSIRTMRIDLCDFLITSQATPELLAEAFGANRTLDSLTLEFREEAHEALESIFARLAAHPQLRHLALVTRGRLDSNALLELLMNSASIKELDLSIDISRTFFDDFCREFQRNAQAIRLACLRLHHVYHLNALAELLVHTVHLRQLHVTERLAESDSQRLLDALRQSSSLVQVTIPSDCTYTTLLPDAVGRKRVEAYCLRNSLLDTMLSTPASSESAVASEATDGRTLTSPKMFPSLFTSALPNAATKGSNSIFLGLFGLGDSLILAPNHSGSKRCHNKTKLTSRKTRA